MNRLTQVFLWGTSTALAGFVTIAQATQGHLTAPVPMAPSGAVPFETVPFKAVPPKARPKPTPKVNPKMNRSPQGKARASVGRSYVKGTALTVLLGAQHRGVSSTNAILKGVEQMLDNPVCQNTINSFGRNKTAQEILCVMYQESNFVSLGPKNPSFGGISFNKYYGLGQMQNADLYCDKCKTVAGLIAVGVGKSCPDRLYDIPQLSAACTAFSICELLKKSSNVISRSVINQFGGFTGDKYTECIKESR